MDHLHRRLGPQRGLSDFGWVLAVARGGLMPPLPLSDEEEVSAPFSSRAQALSWGAPWLAGIEEGGREGGAQGGPRGFPGGLQDGRWGEGDRGAGGGRSGGTSGGRRRRGGR